MYVDVELSQAIENHGSIYRWELGIRSVKILDSSIFSQVLRLDEFLYSHSAFRNRFVVRLIFCWLLMLRRGGSKDPIITFESEMQRR
jgi:hypothetical protein